MNVNIPYDKSKDRTFYKDPSEQGTHVDIGNGIFAIMFPEDGHGPQHKVRVKEVIKRLLSKFLYDDKYKNHSISSYERKQ